MAQSQLIREQRHDQIYPTLDPFEIERVRQFGDPRSFNAGESLWTVGKVAPGLVVILAGRAAASPSWRRTGGYEVSSGTSYSAAEVSGIAALMLEILRRGE